ncbi:MAG: Hsp70 family protein [Deltaproteobacteria bacterium]|nr:Hsp70 family protein [Deltaproteobacteria bacterium]
MGKAIGIDLGTTNSCAAIVEGGKPRVITYKGGQSTIPSVFAINEKGERLVGHDAKRQAQLNPTNTVAAAKRLIGRNYHSKTIEKVKQVFTYELVEGESNEVLIKVRDQLFTLEQISAAILRKIKEVAEEALSSEVDQAVITVPAYFNDRQRQAVRAAGKLANLKVPRVLNEPTAAALAYGLGKNLNQRVAVYDLGGGTFDISVIDIKERIFEVIATGGDTFLGGVDFDDRIMQWVLEGFQKAHGIDLSYDRVAIQRIRDAAETAKIELSSVMRTRLHIPYIAKGEEGPMLDVDVELTREKLEELSADLVDRTVQTVERIFREAGTTKQQVDEVLLVGGQSRMPLVQRRVTEFMGRPPSKGVHPDEAVGIGASIMAHSLAAAATNDDVTLLDVLPMPIGINKVDGSMHVLFHKNERLPDYKTRTLTTSKDNQRSIMLKIYQGEQNICADNELLGTFVFSNIRPAPKSKVQLEVTFHIDSEGILNLTARDKQTGQTVESTLKLGKVGEEKKKEPEKKPEAAPPVAPPMPFTMPQSTLAATTGKAEPKAEPELTKTVSRAESTLTERAEAKPTEEQAAEDAWPLAETTAAPTAEASLWDKVTGWFKGLFG